MQEEVDRAAAGNAINHSFENYTYRLQSSLRAEVISDSPNESQVDLIMGATDDWSEEKKNTSSKYAKIVYDNGRNPQFDGNAEAASEKILESFNRPVSE